MLEESLNELLAALRWEIERRRGEVGTLLESKNPRVTRTLAGLGIRSHGIREVVRANGLIRVAVREVYFSDYWLSQLVEIRDLFLAIEWTPEGLRLVFKDESLEPRPEL